LGVTTGIVAGVSYEARALRAQLSARRKSEPDQNPVQGLQLGKLGGKDVSRLIIGGNLISGSAHAGDLLYQSDLMTRYFTSEKIFETWEIAEGNGINTTLMRADPHIIGNFTKYCRERGSRLQWIAQTAPEQGDPVENSELACDNGAFAVYLHGGVSDRLVKEGKVDQIGEAVEGFKRVGVVAGAAAHRLETVQAIVKAGITPDFYMFTINRVNYHSSDPGEIEAFMKNVDRPWLGFKVLGAGRDKPDAGFTHAFQRGADFVAVGMFDWQVRSDAALVKELLDLGPKRKRAWKA
jgi:hypothetical protein